MKNNGMFKKGEKHPNWKGGKTTSTSYVQFLMPNHPRADKKGYVFEQNLIAEEVFGGALPKGAVVHHINGVKTDNRKENLVICQDRPYHLMLHRRQRALEACGKANWRKCKFCKEHDDPDNLYINGNWAYHVDCARHYNQKRLRKAA